MKKAIIIGATSGIGLEVTKQLTARGWQVGIAGRRQQNLIEIQRQNLNVVATECIDVTRPDAVEKLNTLIGKLGGCDLYFHSSGIGYQNPSLDVDKELATVETNAMGFTRMVTAMFHYFEQHPEQPGQIAVISSIAGTKGLGAAPAYSSTKRYINHYLECLTQLARMKGMKHLTISDIRPGFVRTALLTDGGKYPLQLDATEVAKEIVDKLLRKQAIITVDWRYRLLVGFWRLIPRWIWIRMRVATLMMLGVFVAQLACAQVPAGRTTTTTLYEEYKPGVVTFDTGRKSRQSRLNIFLKNSTLVFLQGKTVMEATMTGIKSVEIEGAKYLNIGNTLYRVLVADSVNDVYLTCQRTIDIEAWHAEALNNSVIDNLEYSTNSRAINMTRTDDLVNPDSYPVIDTYFFLRKGKKIAADERSVREVLNRKKREQLDQIIYYNFRWSDPDCLAKIVPLLGNQ